MKLILQAIKALFRKIEASRTRWEADVLGSIDNAQSTANNAQSTANKAQSTADSKMNSNNPVGSGSFSMGRKSGSEIGYYSHAEGSNTTASSYYSHAEGNQTTASSNSSHAEGFKTTASGLYSHAEGNNTTALGSQSHAEGYYTTAIGNRSHAEGSNTTASGEASHAEGAGTTASSYYSHAEGNQTTASGYYSHAEGAGTTASGDRSHAEGYHTTASSENQHVQGKYNVEDSSNKYAHIVGNGAGESTRSNVHTLDWNGNAWYAGDIYVGSTSGVNKDEGSKKLATEEYVDSKQDTLIQSGATVGQIAKITAVDSSGKPTAWQAVDIPSGGGEWELIAHINVADDVEKGVTVWEYNNLPRYKYIAYKKVNLVGSSTQTLSGCFITINNESEQPSGMSYGKSGSPQSGLGMIYVTPFGWEHCKTGDSVGPTNYSFGGVNAMYNALPLSDNAITSIKLVEHPTYKIANGEIWLYGKKG